MKIPRLFCYFLSLFIENFYKISELKKEFYSKNYFIEIKYKITT